MDEAEFVRCDYEGCEKRAVFVYTDSSGQLKLCVQHYNEKTGRFNFKFKHILLPGIKPR